MGLGDLTLLLVGGDSLAQQLHVHLEHRGADIERTEAAEALDTIRVAVPDLILLSQDAAASDGERIRDALMKAGKPPRVLALCDKKLGAKIATFKHDFVAALEHDVGAELIASCIESLCTLIGKPSSASRPLRSLVADVRRSHMPSKPISASKQTLAGVAPLVVPVATASKPQIAAPQIAAPQIAAPQIAAPQIAAPKPAAVAPADRPTPVVPAPKPKPAAIAARKPAATLIAAPQIAAPKPAAVVPEVVAPKPAAVVPEVVAPKPAALEPVLSVAPAAPEVVAPKPIASGVPIRTSQPTPLSAMLSVPAAAAKVVISVPAPVAVSKPPVAAPVVIAAEPVRPAPVEEPSSFDEELDISIASLPPPALPVSAPPSLPATSLPTPTPLFVETQTATLEPAPAPSSKPSPVEKARALAMRLSRTQRYAAAAALLLCLAFVTAASMSGDDDESIAAHATASLAQAARPAAPAAAPAPAPAPTPPPAPALASPPAPILAAAPPAIASAEDEEPEDSMIDGELYDPHADPARAKANYLVNMGHRLRKQGRWGMAEASYLKALKAMPNYARAVSGLVAVHLGRRDGVEALRWAKKLVELQPKRGAHQRLLGDAYALTGDKSSARNAWQLATRLGDRTSRSRL